MTVLTTDNPVSPEKLEKKNTYTNSAFHELKS